jgi:hypothetical protein
MALTQVETGMIKDAAVTSAKMASGAARSNFGAGAVLQVVSASTLSNTNTSSTSYVDVGGLTASITPASASNKILVLLNCSALVSKPASSTYGDIYMALVRGSTVLSEDRRAINFGVSTWSDFFAGFAFSHLDSPSSASSVTYKAQIKSPSSSPMVAPPGSPLLSTITLLEIAA